MSKLTPKDAWSKNQKDESRKMKVQSYQNLRNNEINSIIKELRNVYQQTETEQTKAKQKIIWYKPWTWFKVKR